MYLNFFRKALESFFEIGVYIITCISGNERSDTPFVINTSPSSGGVLSTNKTIGGGEENNDFKIYVRTNNDSGLQDYYLKPNELFDKEEFSELGALPPSST